MPEKCLLDPQRDCLGLIKARELEKALHELKSETGELRRQNSASHERIFDRLRLLEQLTGEQRIRYDNILETLNNLKASIDLLAKRLGDIEQRPAKRWESIVGQVLGLVVAAVAGGAIAKFFG